MKNSFIRKGMSVLAALVLFVGILPQAAFASSIGAPSNVEVESGTYTTDTTPTFTWDAPTGATWYEVALDSGSLVSLGNVLTYTASTLSAGWHTFYVIAHDNSGHTSSTASVTFEIDTTGPTVPAVSPSSAYEDQSTTFSVYPYGEAAPASCVLYVDGSSVGSMTKNGSTFTKSYTFANDGTYTLYARCTDGDGNTTNGTSRNVTVYNTNGNDSDDTFVVPEVSPSYAYEDESTTLSVEPYGDLDAETCYLYVDGSYAGSMSEYSGGEFKRSYTFSQDGSYTVYAYCKDEDGAWTRGDSRTVTVYDTDDHDDEDEYPEVPQVSPSSATEDEEVTITVEPEEDENGEEVRWCDLYVDGDNVGDMDENNGEFSLDYTFRNSGYYTVYATCTDEDYDTTTGDSRSVHVYEQDENNDDFTVPAVSPSSADEDEEVTFTVEPYGDLDADACKLYVDGSSVGSMSEDDGEFSRDYTFDDSGDYTVYAYCEDEDDNWHKGTSRTVEVDDAQDNDDDHGDLEVPEVTPSSATEDENTEFTVRPDSDYNVTSCWLYVDGDKVGSMNEESTNKFVAEYEFNQSGSYSVYAVCKDSSGDQVTGDKRTVRVDSDDHSSSDDDVDEGSLIKLSCGASSTVSDSCRAVYYFGEDGKRHAFPNESTFYSWYSDFDDVIEVSTDFMYSLDIGENVTYRPGSVLVKFESSTAVYAIEEPRTLRQYKTWSLLESDYDDDAAEVIVVLPDSLYSSYDLGDKIDSSGDYDRTDAYYSVDNIEDIF